MDSLAPSVMPGLEGRAAAFDAIMAWRAGRQEAIPRPSAEQLIRLMSVSTGEEIPVDYGPFMAAKLDAYTGHTLFLEGHRQNSANFGDVRSIITHPASTTHRQLTDEQRLSAGAGPDVVRLSIGLEDADDLIRDLDTALAG